MDGDGHVCVATLVNAGISVVDGESGELISFVQTEGEILTTNIISVAPLLDQEEVARRMAKYDLNVMPVIDDKGEILGVITIDDIVDVWEPETAA